jgi:hypothetical protein
MILSFLQDIVPAPLARTISYNIEGPISALECRSPTLAQLMARYATLDPVLTRPACDKRKAPSLASPAVKKKRTTKKLLIQVIIPCPPEYNASRTTKKLVTKSIATQYVCFCWQENVLQQSWSNTYNVLLYFKKCVTTIL